MFVINEHAQKYGAPKKRKGGVRDMLALFGDKRASINPDLIDWDASGAGGGDGA